MKVIESIRDFILTCPFLADGHVRVDYLGTEETEYCLDIVPAPEIVKTYINGSSIRQCVFVFASRESYGSEELQNIENNGFYEKFSAWLELQNKKNNLPQMGGNRIAQRIEAQSTGYLTDSTASKARYQVQCRLLYYQEGE